MENKITVSSIVHAPLSKVWECWNNPEHIKNWAFASNDWEVPSAENDLKTGGKFKTRMQAKNSQDGFDFEGVYTKVEQYKTIEYTMSDGRMVSVAFEETHDGIKVTETFDPEGENSEEFQKAGWQSILDNFKKYVEGVKD